MLTAICAVSRISTILHFQSNKKTWQNLWVCPHTLALHLYTCIHWGQYGWSRGNDSSYWLVHPFFSARAFEQFATWLSQISVYGSARWDWCCIKCSRYKHVTVKHSIVKTTCQIMGVQNIFIAQNKKATLKSSNRIIINRRSEQSKYLHPNLPLLCINLYSSNSHTSFATPVQKCHEQGIKFCVKAN